MPITFLLYLTLYLCGTHLILGMLILNLCANLSYLLYNVTCCIALLVYNLCSVN